MADTTFFDDTEVTAEDLNNIAVDLGCATFENFNDEETYNIDNLNNITANLVTKGVLFYGENMAVSRVGNTWSFRVGTGICVFENGAKIRITTPKVISLYSADQKYIYILHNALAKTVTLHIDYELPEGEDYVLLATQDKGAVTNNKDRFASTKVYLPAQPAPVITCKDTSGNKYATKGDVIEEFDVCLKEAGLVIVDQFAGSRQVRYYINLLDGEVVYRWDAGSYTTLAMHVKQGTTAYISSGGYSYDDAYMDSACYYPYYIFCDVVNDKIKICANGSAIGYPADYLKIRVC